MTRLIDADELVGCLQNDPLFDLVERYGITGVIEAQPTVEAIPVEWIQNILTEMSDDSPYRPAVKWLLITYKMEKEEC